MKQEMRIYTCLSVVGLLVSLTVAAQADVLFLAHFDKVVPDADYSAGGRLSASATSTARGGKSGCFPGTPGGAADIGYQTPATASLVFPAGGNIDPRQGTIEFFLKSAWDWSAQGLEGITSEPFIDIPLQNGGHIQVYAYHWVRPDGTIHLINLAFNIYDGQEDHSIVAGVGPKGKREVPEPWKKDQWHHIVVSWTPTQSRLFADGKLLGSERWDPPLNLGPVKDDIRVGGDENTGASRVLIDELRIQNVAVEQVTVPAGPYPVPEAAQPKQSAETAWSTIPCYKAAAPPVVDGKVNDKVWKQIPWVGGLQMLRAGGEFAAIPTRFALCYDERALYLAVVCSEPDIAGLKATQRGDDARVFSDDAIEFFVDPLRRRVHYQLAFNTAGERYDGKGYDAAWNGEWTVKVARGESQWSAELCLPFAAIGMTGKPGQVWGINVARDRYAGGGLELSSWSSLTSFHDSRAFGALRFEPAQARPSPKEEATINARYSKQTRAMLENNRRLWQRQLDRALRQISARPGAERLQPEAERLSTLVTQLGKIGAGLSELDESRLMMLGTGTAIDRLVAEVQQAAPAGLTELPADLPAGLSQRGDIWCFVSNRAVFAIDSRSGMLAGLWDRSSGQRLIAASSDHYWVETLTSTRESDELEDKLIQVSNAGGRLRLHCANPNLPAVTLVKEYWLKPGGTILAKRVTVSGKPTEKTLLRISSRTYFDKRFLRRAYYQRLLHPSITVDSVKKAKEITAPVAQSGFMGQCPDGCSQFSVSNLESGLGVGQYQLRVNGKFAYPPRSLNMSYWMPWGWEMSWLAQFLHPEPFSVEMDYMLYEGDHFTFHTLYQQLPEWKELHASYTICPWAAKTRALTMPYVHWGHLPAGNSPIHPDVLEMARIPTHLMRPDEKTFYLMQEFSNNWGEYPTADGETAKFREPNTDRFKSEIPAEKIKHGITRLHGLGIPQYKLAFYQFLLDVAPGTPPEQAGWYIVDKQGNPVSGYFWSEFKAYMTDMSPEFIEYSAQAIARVLDYYGTDCIYIDWPYPPCFADWKGKARVTQPTDTMELFRRLHDVCASRGAALMVNAGAGVPYVDAGFFEGIPERALYMNRGFLEGKWGNIFSDPMMMMKLYEPPGFASYIIPWDNLWSDPERDNGREITNYSLLFGMRTSGSQNSERGEQIKAFTTPGGKVQWLANARFIDMYHRATMELGASRIVDVGLRPCWWREDTQTEAYALQMGRAHVLTCLSHYKEPRPVTLSARGKALGLVPGKRTFIWNFKVRSLKTIIRQPAPPPSGWDRLCSQITCNSFVQDKGDRLSVELGTLSPLLVRLASVTQVPGALVSAYGQKTQFILPHNLDCSVDGSADEAKRTVNLKVSADKPCEVIAWWPRQWNMAATRITGPEVRKLSPVPAGSYVTYGQERFVRLSLPAGESSVVVTQAE